ncbi:DUF6789 family protein [Aquipuribacter nitratireducens]|uniref:DUF6789 family protein n=1 Tax=Aquipuribacter nitratireducens TaxID=650104 RepID=A0ABW0GMC3_9MICO
MSRAILRVVAGAVAGGVATVPMSAVVWGARGAGLLGTAPPRRLTDRALQAIGVDLPEPARRAATAVDHAVFGAVAGGAWGVIDPLVPAAVPRWLAGAGYGLAVWASAYLGWVPAVRAMPSAEDDRRDRAVSMVVAHLVYGVVLGEVARRLRAATAGADHADGVPVR